MPEKIGKSYHKSWILCLSWSPDGIFIASGGLDNLVGIWKKTSKELEAPLKGHKDWVACLSWKPCHLEFPCRHLLSGSKDGSILLWDIYTQKSLLNITAHKQSVKSVRWGGDGRIFSGSSDGTIKIWSSDEGQLILILSRHQNWVNMICLSTDYVLQCGIFDLIKLPIILEKISSNICTKAIKRYKEVIRNSPVRLASGSDDFTLLLWSLKYYDTPRAQMIGHQKPINYLSFSPNGKWLISASFDNCIKLWCGMLGRLLSVFNAHKGPVYVCAWSLISRFFVSASKDSILKIWDVKEYSLKENLLGHNEHIFAVDWSPDGLFVASGGNENIIKLWKR
jgi:ribosome assembly protein 4